MITKKGEMICDKCNGEGNIGFIEPDKNGRSYWQVCPKCLGFGKVDWIENIIGKK